MKLDGNQGLKDGADGFLMTYFGFFAGSPLLVPSLPLSSYSCLYNNFNRLFQKVYFWKLGC